MHCRTLDYRRSLYLTMLLFCPLLMLLGQTYYQSGDFRFEHIQRRDGLPDNSVLSMIQDRQGYLWMGSFNGLIKYDGYEFRSFKNIPGDTSSITGNDIYALMEDRDSHIWAVTWGGVNRFDPITEKSKFIECFARDSYVKGVDFKDHTISQDSAGYVWVGSGYGLSRIDKNNFDKVQAYNESSYPRELLALIDDYADKNRIAGILEVPQNSNLSKSFTLSKRSNVLVVSTAEIGPGIYDYGWLEDRNNQVLWKITDGTSFHAGGSFDNRINLAVLDLDAGPYTIHYYADGGHNHGSWFRKAPNVPGSWGIQVIELSDIDKREIKEHVNKAKTQLQPGGFVGAILTDDNGRTWIGSNNGLYEMKARPTNSSLDQEVEFIRAIGFGQNVTTITGLCKSKTGLWIAGVNLDESANPRTVLQHFLPDQGKAYTRILPFEDGISIRDLKEDSAGNLWLGTNGVGVYRMVIPEDFNAWLEQPMDQFELSPQQRASAQDNHIFSLSEDHSNNMWFGSWDEGLFKLNPNSNVFKFRPLSSAISRSSESIYVNELIKDAKGRIWLGTDSNELIVQDSNGIIIEHFKQKLGAHTLPAKDVISKLYEDSQNNIWIIARFSGIYRYLSESRQIIKVHGRGANNVFEYPSGILWFSTGSGILRYRISDKRIDHFISDPDNSMSLSGNSVLTLLVDRHNILWAGCDGTGLNRMINDPINTPSNEVQFERFLTNFNILDLYDDGSDTLWIGTNARGLIKFHKESGTWTSITMKDGLISDQIESILEDAHGNKWLFSPEGISRYNSNLGQLLNFSDSDGLELAEIFGVERAVKTDDGRFLLCGVNGFYEFNPDSIKGSLRTPLVNIESLNVAITSEKDRSKSYATIKGYPVTLKPREGNFTIEYIGLDYDRPSLIQYRYRMLGLDDNWIDAGTERRARYAYLPHGRYTFEVVAAARNGIWSMPAQLTLVLLPRWYHTSWARLSFLFAALGLLYVARRLYLNRARINQRLEMQEFETTKLAEMNQIKTKFYNNISHEFRTPVTVILGMADKIKEDGVIKLAKNIRLIEHNGRQILKLINQMLDLSKLEAGMMKFNFKESDLVREARYLVASFKSLAENKGVELGFKSETDRLRMIYDDSAIEQIISNLLTNAIKFTERGGHVNLNLSERSINKRRMVQIEVQDTGIGIPGDELPFIFDRFYQVSASDGLETGGTGIGLSLIKEIIDQLQGEVTVSSKEGEGSTFTVFLPIKTDIEFHSSTEEETIDQDLVDHELSEEKEQTEPGLFLQPASDLAHILLIDDNPDVVEYMVAILDNAYHISIARDGHEGYEKTLRIMPDIIISDVMMPVQDGFELCQKIKDDERTSHIPVILLTAKAMHQDRLEGLKRGADSYLAKPFNKEELFLRIEKLLELRTKLQQYYNQRRNLDIVENASMKRESIFLTKVRSIVHNHIDDVNFGHAELEKALMMSRTQVYGKIKALTGKSVALHIRSLRLHKARELLRSEDLNITQVAYEVGFKNASHFSRYFKEEFGHTPSAVKP